jgi:hypothetical protein
MWGRFRRHMMLPFAIQGGRDMVMLKRGAWVDVEAPANEVEWHYDSEKHQLISPSSEGRLVRWPWISATVGDHDLSDFFGTLRLSAGHTLTNDMAMMLYVYQKGWVPTGVLHVILRDGSEERYTIRHGYLTLQRDQSHTDISHIDYIR